MLKISKNILEFEIIWENIPENYYHEISKRISRRLQKDKALQQILTILWALSTKTENIRSMKNKRDLKLMNLNVIKAEWNKGV